MTMRRYAAGVAISAGLFVTGVVWWQRQNPRDAGEDIAAIKADVWERTVALGSLGETNGLEIVFSQMRQDLYAILNPDASAWMAFSNDVSAVRERADLEQIAQTLKWHFLKRGVNDFGGPYWTTNAPDWETGDTILSVVFGDWVSATSTVSGVTFTEWRSGPPTNASPTYTTQATRRINEAYGTQLWQADADHDQSAGLLSTYHFPECFGLLASQGYDAGYSAAPWGILDNYEPYAGAGNWWTWRGFGTNVYIWPQLETNALGGTGDEAVGYLGHVIRTNHLNRFRTVLGDMRTAILTGDYGPFQGNAWAYEAVTRYEALCHTNAGETADAAAFVDALRAKAYGVTNATRTVTTDPAGQFRPDALAEIEINAYFSLADGPGFGFSAGEVDYIAREYEGVYCRWPAQEVYDLGLVARVRYYGVFVGRACAQTLGLGYWDTRTEAAFGTATYADEDFGTGYEMSLYAPPLEMTGSGAAQGMLDTDAAPFIEGPSTWKVHKLADETSPDEAPRFDTAAIGFSGLEMISLATMAQVGIGEDVTGSGENAVTWYYDVRRHEPFLRLYKLICVVDFNFTDYSSGGKGEPYTPPWATNAPAAGP